MAHPQSWTRISEMLHREAKKAAVLTFLLVVLGVLWARMAMKNGETPARAGASMTSNKLLDAEHAAKGTEAVAAFKGWLSSPLLPINRNLFVVNLEHYPQENRTSGDQNTGGGFWGELAKSVSAQADVSKQRQFLLENLQQQASQLRLQTTVKGAKPKAVVNGDLVEEGDLVASGSGEARTTFRVLKIEARRIIVEREGIKLEIPMK